MSQTQISSALLGWYDCHRRTLPWRALPVEIPNPYRVWLSEIMLQQTVAATVGPYFERFLSKWPTVEALAKASLDDVLTEWAGLGYYARARNMHKCAVEIVTQWGGRFPDTVSGLQALPGIGAYTAGAIAAIAFDQQEVAVDGNVERVISRLYRIETPLPIAKPEIRRLTTALVPLKRAGDFAQAMMDLGATVCTPTNPKCLTCPLNFECAAYKTGEATLFPKRQPKHEKPTRYGRFYWVKDPNGGVLVRRRPEKGLLGGMMEFPSSSWSPSLPPLGAGAPFEIEWRELAGVVRHTFTHFHLEFRVAYAALLKEEEMGIWVTPDQFDTIALPSLMRKVAKHVLLHD